MKKLIAVLSAAIIFAFACSNVFAENEDYFHHEEKSVKTATAPVIDGVFSQSEWAGSAKFVMSKNTTLWKVTNNENYATGDIYYLWDDDYLYIACDIKDTTKSNYENYDITKTETDAVLIAFDPIYNPDFNNTKGCYLLKLDPYAPNGNAGWYELYAFLSNDASHGITAKSTINDGVGYIIEAKIPWTFFSAYDQVYYSESGYEEASQQSGFKKPGSKILIKTEHSKRLGVAHILVDKNDKKEDIQFYGDFGRDADSVKEASMYNVLALATDANKALAADPNLPKKPTSYTPSKPNPIQTDIMDLLKLIMPIVVIVILSIGGVVYKIIRGNIAKKKEREALSKNGNGKEKDI